MAQPESASSSDTSFDVRWNEWMALGARREAETARRFRIVLPIIVAFAVGGLYLFAR
jgi:type IV secretory pathway TrbF-like protein